MLGNFEKLTNEFKLQKKERIEITTARIKEIEEKLKACFVLPSFVTYQNGNKYHY